MRAGFRGLILTIDTSLDRDNSLEESVLVEEENVIFFLSHICVLKLQLKTVVHVTLLKSILKGDSKDTRSVKFKSLCIFLMIVHFFPSIFALHLSMYCVVSTDLHGTAREM